MKLLQIALRELLLGRDVAPEMRQSHQMIGSSLRFTSLVVVLAVSACGGDNNADTQPPAMGLSDAPTPGTIEPTPPAQMGEPNLPPPAAASPTPPTQAAESTPPAQAPASASPPSGTPDPTSPATPNPNPAPGGQPQPPMTATEPSPAGTPPPATPPPATPVPATPVPACPTAPPTPNYGSWAPHFAESAYPGERDTVKDFKELMKIQPVFNETGIALPWNLHTPSQAANNPEAKFPLVVYLHGGAERGADPLAPGVHLNNRHMKNFFASANSLLTPELQERFPAYIVAPSCNCSFFSNEWSSNGGANFVLKEDPSEYGAAVLALVEKLIAEQQIDPARVYVTGTSMGGGGSWEFAVRRPDLFAAAIPLSGHPPSKQDLDKLIESKLPVWSNHGQGDGNNPHRDAVEAVKHVSEGGGCAWIASYPEGTPADDPADADPSDVRHNIWARAYTNPELWPWVFSISRPR